MCLAAVLFVTNIEFVDSEDDGVEHIIPEDDYPLNIGKLMLSYFQMMCLVLYRLVGLLAFIIVVIIVYCYQYL